MTKNSKSEGRESRGPRPNSAELAQRNAAAAFAASRNTAPNTNIYLIGEYIFAINTIRRTEFAGANFEVAVRQGSCEKPGVSTTEIAQLNLLTGRELN